MRTWLRAIFTALAGIFTVSLLLWVGTLSPDICGKLWIVALGAAVLSAILFIGYSGKKQ